MKGSLHTDELMAAVVAREDGAAHRAAHQPLLRHGRADAIAETLIITDAAVNIAPTLEDKVDIVQNAIDLGHALRFPEVRVAILSAMETVNPKVPSTVEAARCARWPTAARSPARILDGPLALDNAINLEAAKIKKIESPVAGRANVLIVPDLEAGNMLAKSLTFLAGADAAGIVLGAKVPIILTSRADSVMTRLASCGVAVLVANARREAPRRSCDALPPPRSASRGWTVRGRPGRRAATAVPAPQEQLTCPTSSQSSTRARRASSSRCSRVDADGLAPVAARPGGRPLHVAALRREGRRGADPRREVLGRGRAASATTARSTTSSPSCARKLAEHRLVGVGHRVVHGGLEYAQPVRVDAKHRRRAGEVRAARAAAPAAQPRADPGAAGARSRSCRRWPASTPRSIAASRRSRRRSRCRRRSPTAACGATASTASRTSTSRPRCRRTTRGPPPAGRWSPHLGNGASMCAMQAGAASRARWASPRSTACRWARAAATSIPAWCST